MATDEHPFVWITSLASASRDFARHRCDMAVSLLDPGLAPPRFPGLAFERHVVRLFHDIDAPVPGFVMPCRGMVASLVAAAEGIGPGDRLLVHCVAGLSRSPAAAAVILCAVTGDVEAARSMLRAQGPFVLNHAILALGDDHLGMGGRLLALSAEFEPRPADPGSIF